MWAGGGVVDDAGCKPYGCRKNNDRICVVLTRPGCLSLSLIAARSREDFFYVQSRKKGLLESVFLCFNAPPRPSQNQAVLAAGLEGAGTRARDFQHYVRS